MTATLERTTATAVFASHRRRRSRRVLVVCLALMAAVLGAFAVTLVAGAGGVTLPAALRSLVGASGDPGTDFIVRELRLPRATTSLLVGIALGVSGTIFQRLLANPLASPDVLGVASGAGAAAVAGLILANLSGASLAVVALCGALLTAAANYVLAWRGALSGYRFILVGIGIGAFMSSVTSYLVSRAEVKDARAATAWLVGSSGLAGPAQVRVLGVTVLVLVPAAALLGRRLSVLELGDDAAEGLGVRVETERRALMLVAVALVAVATAAAGPIAFVSLMAGPLAVRLLSGAGSGIAASAGVGALLVLLADLVGQHLLPTALATGVVTGLVGAPYLVWLLVVTNRNGAGG